jgi:alcohol dehydrogenase class IV
VSSPRFEFATATRILFGGGARRDLPAIVGGLGRRALLAGGRSSERGDAIAGALERAGIECVRWSIPAEPRVEDAQAGCGLALDRHCDVVVAVGGGSVIDAAKAAAALATNRGDPLDYLEVIGKGQALEHQPLPFVAVPTTAGSGAEVTRNAVLASPGHGVKVSLRSALMLPRVALVDPELTHGLPPAITAATGLDALAQVIEPFLSRRPSPLIDPLCLDGIRRIARALPRACNDGHDAAAREDMSLASLFGGLALANGALGAVHGFAGPIGGRFSAPHGAVCAALLPHVLRVNAAAAARQGSDETLARIRQVAGALTGRDEATAADAVAALESLQAALAIPRLRVHGLAGTDIVPLVAQARLSSSMRGNPVDLTDDELTEILTSAL